jgi:hypothetical protein
MPILGASLVNSVPSGFLVADESLISRRSGRIGEEAE